MIEHTLCRFLPEGQNGRRALPPLSGLINQLAWTLRTYRMIVEPHSAGGTRECEWGKVRTTFLPAQRCHGSRRRLFPNALPSRFDLTILSYMYYCIYHFFFNVPSSNQARRCSVLKRRENGTEDRPTQPPSPQTTKIKEDTRFDGLNVG